VPREAPALTIGERRAAAGRAMARAREILDTLQQQGVRMPLTDQRLKDMAPSGARACYSALWMAVRRTKHLGRSSKVWMSRRCPRSTRVACAGRRNRVERGCVVPEYVATRLDAMHLSAQQKDALFAMLHSEEGHASCARPSDGRIVPRDPGRS
jgi:hypothetical protein